MFLRLANTPRHYAWGSLSGISELLGTKPSGRPEAELWLGTHGGSPTWLVDHDEGYATLNEFVFSQPERLVAQGRSVPFLMKVLAAAEPLSLQAHPSASQARAGFARENEAGVPLSAPDRNYKDDQAKPELIVAVSEEFVGLSGFRPIAQTLAQFRELLAPAQPDSPLAGFIAECEEHALTSASGALRWVVSYLLTPNRQSVDLCRELVNLVRSSGEPDSEIVQTVLEIEKFYPDDAGVVLAAFLNRVQLSRGEGMYLPAGNLHAYLHGVGIELMNCSDNVLRGGLTSKHVDVDELASVLDFSELADPRLAPLAVTDLMTGFVPEGAGFALFRFDGNEASEQSASVALTDAAIALCTSGSVTVRGRNAEIQLTRGQAVFASVDERELIFSGAGEAFISTSVGKPSL